MGVGTWTHTGSEHSIGDGGRTCTIYVSGRYTVGSVSADIVASTEFYCTAEGNVRWTQRHWRKNEGSCCVDT